ncbi:hypothetical protein, partial [Salmonella enterica]|uniref:hypothetical protein n=1 Tax=Salmonella enterica TaxID=28901 RepID=UPI0015912001
HSSRRRQLAYIDVKRIVEPQRVPHDIVQFVERILRIGSQSIGDSWDQCFDQREPEFWFEVAEMFAKIGDDRQVGILRPR